MKVGILTGGGDCPGLNPAIRGAVARLLDFGYEPVGIIDGWKGMVEGLYKPLTFADVEEIIGLGGTILGTSRTNPFKNEKSDVPKVLSNFKKAGLHALIAIGGDDTLGVARRLYKEHGMNIVGVPKTMDNDVGGTDYTFGFDTAVSVAVDAAERLRDTAKSHHRVMVLEVMGRDAGWVALYTAIASGADWVLLPEFKYDLKELAAHLKACHERGKDYAVIIVSEGIQVEGLGEQEAYDSFGHTLLQERGVGRAIADKIQKLTGYSVRSAQIGHIQRGGPPTLFDRILGTRFGVKAAELVNKEDFGKMVALKGDSIVAVPLEETSELKTVPKEWYELARVFFK